MGCCSSSAVSETELNHAIRASRESVIGFFTDFVVDAETKYFLKAKSHSAESDDYDIRDHKGTLAFKVLTRQWSMRCKKVLLDAEDHPVLCIGLNRSTTYKNFIIHAGGSLRGPELARVQKDITDRTPRLLLTMTQPQRPPVVFELSERWMDRHADIRAPGDPTAAAWMSTGSNGAPKPHGDMTYFLTVSPGVDAALMIAFCICLDDKRIEMS